MNSEKKQAAKSSRFMIVALDETSDWNKESRAAIGKYYSLYLVDTSRVVNLAEITPSYTLHYCGYETEKQLLDPEWVEDAIALSNLDSGGIKYVWASSIDAFGARFKIDADVYVDDTLLGDAELDEEEYDKLIEDALDNLRANPPYLHLLFKDAA